MEHGRKNGISPGEYYDRVTNFSSEDKRLNFLMVSLESDFTVDLKISMKSKFKRVHPGRGRMVIL